MEALKEMLKARKAEENPEIIVRLRTSTPEQLPSRKARS